MSKVYIHNMSFSSRGEALTAWDQPKKDLQSSTFWNIWRNRGPGWGIENGSRILLVGSWPGPEGTTHHILWDARAWDVHKWEDIDWDTAVRRLGHWTGAGVAAVREDPYTGSKKEPGIGLFVMAWRPELVAWMDQPLPRSVHITRNGWAVMDDAELVGKGGKRPVSKGQGRRLDVASRDAVEDRAMEVADQWFRERGWTEVKNTSKNKAWDYESVDERKVKRFVEVKGTTGAGASFEITAGEVNAARDHGDAHLLIAVTGISLVPKAGGDVSASGGVVRVFDPWRPLDRELRETRYTWTPDEGRAP